MESDFLENYDRQTVAYGSAGGEDRPQRHTDRSDVRGAHACTDLADGQRRLLAVSQWRVRRVIFVAKLQRCV